MAQALGFTYGFAGHVDWRLPSVRELQSIVNHGQVLPAINASAFPATPASSTSRYWSSTVAVGTSLAWTVDFAVGGTELPGDDVYHVRLVRTGQPSALLSLARPASEYFNYGDGTVTHIVTGLMWQRCAIGQTWTGSTCSGVAQTYSWAQAQAITGNFALHSDWRLPTVDELLSLVDYTAVAPALNGALFPNTPLSGNTAASDFWSASPIAGTSGVAWNVNFRLGRSRASSVGSALPIRLVRTDEAKFLNVSLAGAGMGIVTGSGINCGSVCMRSYTNNASVTLIAAPTAGSSFAGWSGACTNSSGPCSVTMDGARSVTATFVSGVANFVSLEQPTYSVAEGNEGITELSVPIVLSRPSPGSVVVHYTVRSGTANVGTLYDADVGGSTAGNITFEPGQTKATARVKFAILGDYVSENDEYFYVDFDSIPVKSSDVYFLNYASKLTATVYILNDDPAPGSTFALSVTKGGAGSGTVVGPGIDCGNDCSETFASGTSITLTATPASGAIFKGWSGACTNITGPCTVQMTAAKSVSADFILSNLSVLQATDIAAGSAHTCAVTPGGGVRCWGANSVGQLGDGTTINHSEPVPTLGLNGEVSSIAAGQSHTCALMASGKLNCWGDNSGGQLGDGTWFNRLTATAVTSVGGDISAVVAGSQHTCVLTTTGGVTCFGYNGNGQLGTGDYPSSNLITVNAVLGLSRGVSAIAAGAQYNCVATSSGGVKCWGWNGNGQLGDGTVKQRFEPVDVLGLSSGIRSIVAGKWHACALTNDGGVKCWGHNASGQLGDGTTTQRLTPVDVIGLRSGVAALAAGADHTCALTDRGTMKCWGFNGFGQGGDGTTAQRLTPIDVVGLSSKVVAITAGDYHTCALTENGALNCWGRNDSGQLGDSSTTMRLTPTGVLGSSLMPPSPSNYQGLWWNPQESGWGINFAHQGDTIFATWFTYDASGKPWWLVAVLEKKVTGVYSGTIWSESGPLFESDPFGPPPVDKEVGTMTVTFADDKHASVAYAVNGTMQTKAVVPQEFGPLPTCVWGAQPNLALATNYTDLWWSAAESGWGVNFTHQGDTIFATWFTYDMSGNPWWLVAVLNKTAADVYSGTIWTEIGPPFNSAAWNANPVTDTEVGTASVTIANGNAATFTYTMNGKTRTKAITRQVFAPPGTVCQ